MSKIANHSKSVLKFLNSQLSKPTTLAEQHARYVGAQGHQDRKLDEQSKLNFLGYKVPLIKLCAKKVYSHSSLKVDWDQLSDSDFFSIWQDVWLKSSCYEIKSIALYEMSSKRLSNYRHKNPTNFFQLANHIDNWAHSDELSGIIADIVENNPKHLKQLKAWNRSANPWHRRQSLVGIYFYARFRKKFVPVKTALQLIENLLADPHFYVQRAVGWALREVDRVDSKLQRAFVINNLNRISAVAWFATSELYPLAMRKKLAVLRKKLRSTT